MNVGSSATPVGLLLSGGLDSCILLGHLLAEGHRVRPFYVRSGLAWQREELRAAQRFLTATAAAGLDELIVLDLPLEDLYDNHWSTNGRDVPDGASDDEAVYLPGRNPLLLIKPVVWCHMHGIDRLAVADLRSNPFADATSDFFERFQSALNLAVGGQLRIERPFGRLDKRGVMQRGRRLPLHLTFSCIAPVDGKHCGHCNKCAERIEAFRSIDAEDPTVYAQSPVGSGK